MEENKHSLSTLAAAAGTVAVAALIISLSKKKETKSYHPPPSKPIVYGFMPLDGYADSSPACLKLMTFLKMCNVEFDVKYYEEHEMKNSPKMKMPDIHWDKLNSGEIMGDSTLIMNEMVRMDPQTFVLDGHLTAEQVAVGTAFKTMMEESMYWYIIHARWVSPEFDRVTAPTYFGGIPLPLPLKGLIIKQIRNKMIRDAKGHGVALLDDAEVVEKFRMELGALSEYLGNKKYFMGDKISSYDATVYGYFATYVQGEWKHEMYDEARECKNLMEYMKRMREEFWPEMAS